jgi:3-hydroxyisobutyrate dehydrogenase-like beta-hydroxyacid dehydrogenase
MSAIPKQVGFVGLGNMGFFMAKNLAQHLPALQFPPLLVFNRTQTRSQKLVSELDANLIVIARDIEEIASKCDIVITNLLNDTVVREVLGQIAQVWQQTPRDQPRIIVETSTIYPTVTAEVDDLFSSVSNTRFIMSPVFGPPPAAASARLMLCIGGEYHARKEIIQLLVPSMARKALEVGESVVQASTMKLLGNGFIMSAVEVVGESVGLAEATGVDPKLLMNFVEEYVPSRHLGFMGNRMIIDDFDGTTGFAINGALKDGSHVRHLSLDFNCPMPIVDIVHQNWRTGRALHEAEKESSPFEILDNSALIAALRVAAGFNGLNHGKHRQVQEE